MISEIPAFSGYERATFNFLEDLSGNNSLSWFAENRERYNNFIVLPSKSLIVSIAPFFNQLEPAINTEPKFDKTLMRINKDFRFSNGVPYRTYFVVHFRRFKSDSEFYVYIDKNGIECGLYINNSYGDELYFSKNLFQKSNSNTQIMNNAAGNPEEQHRRAGASAVYKINKY